MLKWGTIGMVFFELQDDNGDEERVKMNLISLAAQQGTLKRTEENGEIKFEGMIILHDN